jgi:hypothetical protein
MRPTLGYPNAGLGFTLLDMGKADDRITKEFDPRQLAALAKATGNEVVEEDHATPIVTVGRTKTLDDPMTTALLAEVAHRSKTIDFDREVIDVLLESIDNNTAETTHPNVKRRKA